MGTPVVLEWPLDLYILYSICRYKFGSPGFRGGFAEISSKVFGRAFPRRDPSRVRSCQLGIRALDFVSYRHVLFE